MAEQIKTFAKHVVVLHGGTGQKQRKQTLATLQNIPENEERVLIATGRYFGEGFDDAKLDLISKESSSWP